MLSPQRALLCNLNHIHLQHVSLGLHLSRRPELREGSLSTSPPPGDTGGKESRGPCSGALVDANSNSPAVPCRCCQEHGPSLENRQDPVQEEEGAASPSDPGCSSSLSSCSDLSPDESPISVYSQGLPGEEDVHPQPSIIPLEQGSPLASAGPGACSPDSFCCSPDSCSGASSPRSPGLDSNRNTLTTCQEPPSPGLEEEEEGGEQDLLASELPEPDAGKTEPSWKINPIWKIDTELPDVGWKATGIIDSGCTIRGNSSSSWTTEPAKLDSGCKSNPVITEASPKTDAGWSDVSGEPASHRTITSFHELAQKRKRGPGLPPVPQVKKDRSDWLIVFSPDSELPPSGSLGGSPAPPREVTTFKELRSRSRATPPPVPPRDPPVGWALVPPRPPPPPVPPRRRKNRPGLQPITERPPEEGRAGSPVAGQEAAAAREPEEPGAQASRAAQSSWSFAGVPGAQRRWMAEAQSGTGQLQEQKKGLLIAVSASVDKIISHFGAARNLVQKAQLGDSRLSPDVGHLVLTTLCPALHALVADGLKPFRKDLITGQRRSSPWSVVEASVKPGASSRALGTLYGQVSRLAPLSSSRSRFHAFILGLLNTKQLELWFSSLQEDAGLLSLLYLPTGFFSLARAGCPALATELLLLLQPLSVLTFHLDLLFEHHHHLPLGPPPTTATPGSPPALQQTVHAVLHWGGRLAQSLRGAPGDTPSGPSALESTPAPGSWWEQLTQASRVYASGGTEGFPLPRWRAWRPGTAAGGPHDRPLPTEEATAGRGPWLGRLFGVPGGLAEGDGGTLKSRRPSSWLPPTVSVLALVKRGAPPETNSSPEELEASAASMVETHRSPGAWGRVR
ncbi:AP-4 complex accessory subunit RUSC1 isoform X5 [Canis lupus baileyi]|uniref:AP-4 complex accessory subunit RUSC1 isoform X4 n=1 Tax=Canis lupus dingo TaxID=286419 RepID=UPI000DC663F2|nr:AP-4 complex accessory subunit RUSC1 isoform X4 [Canis lupus dingo]XP_038399028.1 RUN and SH3 domain-containing protein 1 isoform X5 [Canis lupus familiaris]XP_038427224.1 RUN and SH3 domain-containing protein 1 isoform X5 [Canis lupus familiaris]XP_038527860.1 RUN and SH3 domain-containing protein 1 isoform X5 [Canis lupus familiaris]